MEAVVFIGLQASGKSSFFKERFFRTHARISLDLLKTRNREWQFLQVCLQTGQRLVIDNTNPTREDRARFICPIKDAGFRLVGFYFQSHIDGCLERNRDRCPEERVPDLGICSTAKKLELPSFEEGFDQLYYVRLDAGQFVVEEWQDEV
ncbi:AAA family ATPase [Schlesneria sp. DSM 10557]|uniref:AAA family ATPase n=1 Tax=Schlesneria sp. DSM 10557 TaxID=3044399 RepID=UPI0035A006CD